MKIKTYQDKKSFTLNSFNLASKKLSKLLVISSTNSFGESLYHCLEVTDARKSIKKRRSATGKKREREK